ncbi:MAG TPA: alpha-L-rhamnosidase C-terminal domain-containing protein, partial [Puia sp.]
YNTELSGSFTSSDPFLNILWEKARRTLYVNMRDGYMDCPDRERAAWTGDAVNESGQAFYALSPSSHALTKKWLYELIRWQRDDGAIFSPVPAGNWVNELPCQSVTSIGEFGLWNYYLNTGDRQAIVDLYEGARRYLDLWKEDGRGTVIFRRGNWTWGDWGDNIDTVLLYNLLYYTGVSGMHKMAQEIGRTDDARRFERFMNVFRESFNRQFWNGKAYRSPGYTGDTDDRVQALAVVTGVAGEDKFPALLHIFQTTEHASPYMEKYVLEAMFRMNDVDEALARLRRRFGPMVDYPGFTTLFEGWGPGKEGFGGGTINHAWSGGPLTILSRYLCGIAPVEPAYRVFGVLPQPGSIAHASAVVSSVAGKISVSFVNEPRKFKLSIGVPKGTNAIAGIPDRGYRRITLDGQTIWKNGKYIANKKAMPVQDGSSGFIKFNVADGEWDFSAVK